MTFEEQIKLIKLNEKVKKSRKPIVKRPRAPKGEVWIHYGRNRIRGNGGDLSYSKIAELILSGIKIKATCTMTGRDMTERVVLSTMNNYLANYNGNLEKYLDILMSSKK